MTIDEWLQQGSSVPRLDKELILCYNIGIDRAELILRGSQTLTAAERAAADQMLAARAAGQPLAYLTGHKEFYGRDFLVTPAVLIPRPETEDVVAQALQLIDTDNYRRVLEVGTGSGAIAVTLACERPDLQLAATDLDLAALTVARENATRLGASLEFIEADLLDFTPAAPPELIVANLPYVDRDWEWLSPELAAEPAEALFADDGGLAVIKKLIKQAHARFPRAALILESDPSQQAALSQFAAEYNYAATSTSYATLLRPEAGAKAQAV